MKTVLALVALLTFGIFISSLGIAAPDTTPAAVQHSQQATALKSGSIDDSRMVNRIGPYSPIMKLAKACKTAGQECNYQACPSTGRNDLLGNCKSDCCAGKCVFYPAQPGATGYGPLCQ